MCGIVGLFTKERPILPADNEQIRCVLEKIAYRGPDGVGTWHSERVLLGHRRLSIIDLSPAGAQPFIDVERGLVITFNGEIYNYQELREHLVSMGYRFKSQTDTEVILRAYDQYGMDFLHHLQGMFAFCLYDQKEKIAVLARDAAGEKPLYFYLDSDQLLFSSEIKAFHAFPQIDLSIDVESLKAFFALQYIPGPHTIYSRIMKLAPGCALHIDLDKWKVRETRFWSLESHRLDPSTPEEIEALLAQSVRYRLIADVEIGLLLSGGIDSALLAAYVHESGEKLRVFTARFDEEQLDESRFAEQVADHFGFQQIMITGGQLTPEIFDEVIYHGDELLGDPACVPTFLLSREISKHVKVVLSGEGADELFWGYDTYRLEKIWRLFSWLRGAFSKIPRLQRTISDWETSNRVPPSLTRLGKLVSANYDLGAARWTSVFADHSVKDMLPPGDGERSLLYLQSMEERLHLLEQQFDPYEASLAADLLFWLPDDLLMKVDRMTMAHGVEARTPYLARDLMLRALALPRKYKVQGRAGKFILRKLVERQIPGNVGRTLAWRKKHGFEVPVDHWLRNQLRELMEERLSPAKLAKSGLLDAPFVLKLRRSFYSASVDSPLRRKLWMLLCFQSWYEMHEAHFGFR